MTPEETKQRTKTCALRVPRVVQALPREDVARELGNQFLRPGASVGANYRAACRGKSRADFINKLKIVEEECVPAGPAPAGRRRNPRHRRRLPANRPFTEIVNRQSS